MTPIPEMEVWNPEDEPRWFTRFMWKRLIPLCVIGGVLLSLASGLIYGG